MKPVEPKLKLAFEMRATVGAPTEVGKLPDGRIRRIIPVTGGTFEGPGIKGKVLAEAGADWQVIASDGVVILDARYTLQTDQGHFIYVWNQGIRHGPADVLKRLGAGEAVDPALYYFRTSPVLEAAAPELEWVRRSVFVASGARDGNWVVISFYKVE
jgi:hypothetical protein